MGFPEISKIFLAPGILGRHKYVAVNRSVGLCGVYWAIKWGRELLNIITGNPTYTGQRFAGLPVV